MLGETVPRYLVERSFPEGLAIPIVTTSRCPAGGTHSPPDQSGSRDYILPFSMALL